MTRSRRGGCRRGTKHRSLTNLRAVNLGLSGRRRVAATAPADCFVAEGVVRPKSTQIVKALARDPMGCCWITPEAVNLAWRPLCTAIGHLSRRARDRSSRPRLVLHLVGPLFAREHGASRQTVTGRPPVRSGGPGFRYLGTIRMLQCWTAVKSLADGVIRWPCGRHHAQARSTAVHSGTRRLASRSSCGTCPTVHRARAGLFAGLDLELRPEELHHVVTN